jgi:hypothetical protein
MNGAEFLAERWIVLGPVIATAESVTRSTCSLQAIIVCPCESINLDACTGARSSCERRVAAQHCNTRTELRAAKRDHVLPLRKIISETADKNMLIHNPYLI